MLRLQGVITAFFKPQECQQQDGCCSELRTGTFAPAKMPVRMKVLKHFKLTSVERFSWIFRFHLSFLLGISQTTRWHDLQRC